MPMSNVNGLAHIGLHVSSIARSKAFYTEVLGFAVDFETVTAGGTALCFIKNNDCMIELIEQPDLHHADGFFEHVALKVENIEAAVATLKSHGYETEFEIREMPMIYNGIKMVMFRGPDGERLEFNQFL